MQMSGHLQEGPDSSQVGLVTDAVLCSDAQSDDPALPRAGAATSTDTESTSTHEQLVSHYSDSISSFEEKWKKFQGLFDQLNESLGRALARSFGIAPVDKGEQLTSYERASVFGGASPSFAAVCEGIRAGKYKKIVVACGAGISTSAGIPDFRSPGTGLFSVIAEEQKTEAAKRHEQRKAGGDDASQPLPEAPEDQMRLDYYRMNPSASLRRWHALWPGQGYRPTAAHILLKVLHERGVLLRVFTQNIDSLELEAGLGPELVVQAHGHLRAIHCTDCAFRIDLPSLKAKPTATYEEVKKKMMLGVAVMCPGCSNAWLKPAVVLFGEQLPSEYGKRTSEDLRDCDLLIVMGTSLLVTPFSNIPFMCGAKVPRVLLNRELAGCFKRTCGEANGSPIGNYRDVAVLGPIDESCAQIAACIGCSDFDERCRRAGCRVIPSKHTAPSPQPRVPRDTSQKKNPPPTQKSQRHQLQQRVQKVAKSVPSERTKTTLPSPLQRKHRV